MRKHLPALLVFVLCLALCCLPYLLLPLGLYEAPEALIQAGLLLLLWVLYPLEALLLPGWMARLGIPAILACVVPTIGYLLLLVHQMTPVLGVLIAGQLVAVVSASTGQELRRRAPSGE